MIVEKPGRVGKLKLLDELSSENFPRHATLRVGSNVGFKVVVYVDDDCAPCDYALEAVMDVESLNKHILFELVNLSHMQPEHEAAVSYTPSILVVSLESGRTITVVKSVFSDEKLNVRLVEELLATGYIYTHPYTSILLEKLVETAKAHNLVFNDPVITQKLLVDILRNVDEYHYGFCPCKKQLWLNKTRDPETIETLSCPCLQARLNGTCHCKLLVKPEELRSNGLKPILEYLDFLVQTLLRHSNIVNPIEDESIDSLKVVLSRGWLQNLLELEITLEPLQSKIMKKYVRSKRAS